MADVIQDASEPVFAASLRRIENGKNLKPSSYRNIELLRDDPAGFTDTARCYA